MLTTTFRLDNLVSAWFSAIHKLSSRNWLCIAKMIIIITMIITTVKKSFHVYEVGDKPSFSFQPKRVNIYLTPCEIYVPRKTKIRRQTVEVE